MYALHDEVIAKGIGRCFVRGMTYEQNPRYLLLDRRGNTHKDVPHADLRPCERTVAVSCGGSAQIITFKGAA